MILLQWHLGVLDEGVLAPYRLYLIPPFTYPHKTKIKHTKCPYCPFSEITFTKLLFELLIFIKILGKLLQTRYCKVLDVFVALYKDTWTLHIKKKKERSATKVSNQLKNS
jgi:hypothetical protein